MTGGGRSKVVVKETPQVKDEDLEAFADELMAQIGPPPRNFQQIVGEAIKEYRRKKKEV